MGGTLMNRKSRCTRPGLWLRAVAAAVLVFAWQPAARAQQDPQQDGEKIEGINGEQYNIKQSIEFGGRVVDTTGNGDIYKTFVNLQTGPRLLGFTTEMRSLDNHGGLFDRFYVSSFGYGGDPNDVTRVRISRNKWYNFDALLRRDEYFSDYTLQANPLNPTNGFANGPAGFGPLATSTCIGCLLGYSPHYMDTRRNLSDYNLLFLPQSKVRIRAGYSRNINEGPGFTTIHQGTEQSLFQDVKTTLNTYRLGIDYRAIPRTNISYDQIWSDYKGDTGAVDQLQQPNFRPFNALPLNYFQLATTTTAGVAAATPVDLGVSLNSTANQPCSATFNAAIAVGGYAPGTVNATCSAYLNYLTHGRVRTSTPTEQISLQSNYWKPVDISARFSYTAGSADMNNYVENFLGRESRTNLFNSQIGGFVNGQRVAATADFGITWYINDKWRFLDSFHFSNFHNPLDFNYSDCSFFTASMTKAVAGPPAQTLIATPLQFTPTGLPAGASVPFCNGPAGTTGGNPVHSAASAPSMTNPNPTSGSPADFAQAVNGGFLKQEEETNLAEVDYQLSSKFGARVGFRYRHRNIDYSSFTDVINELFYPGGGGGTALNFQNAARGDCAASATGVLPAGCTAFGANGALQFISPAVSIDETGPITINEYAGLFGFWAKPIKDWRISYDMELMSADGVFTRISPRQSQEYRVRSTYKPRDWVNLSGSIRIWEARDNVTGINNLQHDRSYGASALFQANDKWAVDVSYDYNNVFSQILICYPTAGSTVPGLNPCPGLPASANFFQNLSTYENKSHYGGIDLLWKPIPKLTAHLGGSFTGTDGTVLIISPPNQIPGPLNTKWLTPTGGLEYSFGRRWTGRAFWNYYGYHEDSVNSPQDIFAPRNFHTNTVTLSARYAF